MPAAGNPTRSHPRLAKFETRHLNLLADMIRQIPDRPIRNFVARHFAVAMAESNPSFKQNRFLEACDALHL
jgi:hypothetical protein